MQFIQRMRLRFRSAASSALAVGAISRALMRHVGITGRLECHVCRDSQNRRVFVLRLNTFQRIPPEARGEIQQYFRRKLDQLGELQGAVLFLLIQDAEDQARARHANRAISSGRVASLVAAANVGHDRPYLPGEQLDDLRRDVRRRLREQREKRQSDFSTLGVIPLTELGALAA